MIKFVFVKAVMAVQLLTLSVWVNAQNTGKNIFPVSPEVATLGKFVDTPVGTYSGVPDITIPIYNVKYRSLSIPLNLSYHASGVKVEDEASWVGLGWDLFFGGFITQSIIGKEDAVDNLPERLGYSNFKSRFSLQEEINGRSEIGAAIWQGTPVEPPQNADTQEVLTSLLDGNGQPDIYSFSFVGRSGKFVINPETKLPVVLNKMEELEISKLPNNQGWLVKTLDGLSLYFTNKYHSWDELDPSKMKTITWKLEHIESVDGTKIYFQYTPLGTNEGFYTSENYKSKTPSGVLPYQKRVVKTFTEESYLKFIVTPSETIEFEFESRLDRKGMTLSDATSSVKRLKKIMVKDLYSNKVKQAFGFEYDYFSYNNTGSTYAVPWLTLDALGKRLKLKKFYEIGYDPQGNEVQKKPFEFLYNESIALPLKNSFAKDYWGYFNGITTNTTSLPNLTALFYGDSRYYDIPSNLIKSPYKANRGASQDHMKAATLSKIKLPTGGYKEFTFESHSFSNFTYYDAAQIVSLEAGPFSIIDQNFPSTTTTVDIGMPVRAVDVSFDVVFNRGNSAQGLTFDNLKASTVSFVEVTSTGNVRVLKTWQMPDNNDTRTLFNQAGFIRYIESISVTPKANATLKVTVSLPDGLGVQNTTTKNASVSAACTYPNVVVSGSPKSIGGGLRISNVKLRDANDAILYSKDYTYEGGLLLSPPIFLASDRFTFKYVSCPPAGTFGDPTITAENGTLWTTNSESNISLGLSANGGYIGYSTVTESEVSPQGNNGKVVSKFTNQQNSSSPGFPEVPFLKNGLISERSYFTNAGTPLRKEKFTYDLLSSLSSTISGYDIYDTYVGPNEVAPCGGTGIYNPFAFTPRFTLKYYPIKNQYYALLSKTDVTYDAAGNEAATIPSTFLYNGKGQTSKSTTHSSTSDILVKEYKYPIDYSASYPYPLVASMKTDFYMPIIEEFKFFNSGLQQTIKYTYSNSSPATYVLESILEKYADGSEIVPLTNSKFDGYGNPKHQVSQNGVKTIILWGRGGGVPVAKIEGINLSSVENTLVSETTLASMEGSILKAELLKLYLINEPGMITLYLYNDKNQLVEMIDSNKVSTYYSYDEFGRLATIKDHQQNVIKNFTYNLQD